MGGKATRSERMQIIDVDLKFGVYIDRTKDQGMHILTRFPSSDPGRECLGIPRTVHPAMSHLGSVVDRAVHACDSSVRLNCPAVCVLPGLLPSFHPTWGSWRGDINR